MAKTYHIIDLLLSRSSTKLESNQLTTSVEVNTFDHIQWITNLISLLNLSLAIEYRGTTSGDGKAAFSLTFELD